MRKIKLHLLSAAAIALAGVAYAAPVSPPAGNAIQNSAIAQQAQFNTSSGTVRGPLKVGSVQFPDGTIQTSSPTGFAFPLLPNGVMQLVGTSSSVVTAAVSLSTQVIGNLSVTHLNSGSSASASTWWNGSGAWLALPASNGPLTASVGGTQISSPTAVVNFDSATFSGAQSPTGTANITLSGSSVTLQGNSFNGANQILKLNGSGLVPNSAIDTSSVTKLGQTITLGVNTSGIYVASVTASAPLTGSAQGAAQPIVLGVDGSSVTLRGNTFNTASKLVALDSSAKLPAVDGSQLLNLPSSVSPGATFYIQNGLSPQPNSGLNVSTGNIAALTVNTLVATTSVLSPEVNVETTNGSLNSHYLMANSGTGYELFFLRSSGTIASPLPVVAGNELGSIFFNGYVNGAFNSAGSIRSFVDSGSLATAVPNRLMLATQDGSGTDKYRMELRSNGQVRIGQNLNGSETQSSMLHVEGSIGTDAGVNTSTLTIRSQGPGVLHVDVSSNAFSGAVQLSTEVAGVLAPANGGTGQSTFQDGDLLIGNSATGGLVSTNLLSTGLISIVNGNGTITVGSGGNYVASIATNASTIGGVVAQSSATVTIGVNPSSGTLQGNVFNGASQLVQTTSGGAYPSIPGSGITGIPQFASTGTWTAAQTNTSSSTIYGEQTLGVGPVSNATATIALGGSLTAGVTYYYKVYPLNQSGFVGTPSPEMNVLATSSNKTVNLSWTLTPGATYYRVSRGTAQGSQDGYFQIATATFTDTGGSFTAGGNAFSQSNVFTTYVAGPIVNPGSSGGLDAFDYVTGARYNILSLTSAGEMQLQAGMNGSNAGTFFFQGSNGLGEFQIDRSAGTTELVAWSNPPTLSDLMLTFGTNVKFLPGDSYVENIDQYGFHAPAGSNSHPSFSSFTDNTTGVYFGSSVVSLSLGGANDYNFLTGSFRPGGDGTQDLGSPSAHWHDLDASGAARLSGASSQIVFGTTVTLNAVTTGSVRAVVLPDPGVSADTNIILSTGTQTIGGTLVIASSTSYAGSVGGAVAQGNVGYQTSISQARPGTPLVNNTAKNIPTTQLTLQPGHYLLIGQAGFAVISGTPASTTLSFAISTTSGTLPSTSTTANPDSTGQTIVELYGGGLPAGSSQDISGSVVTYTRISTATTYNLVGFVQYSAGQIDGYGSLQAIQLP